MAEQMEIEVDEEEHDQLPKISAKRKAVTPSLAEPSDISTGKRKKRAAEESKDEPKKKKKKIPVGTDEVISEMKGLAIEKVTLAKSEKAKTGGKTTERNGPTPALIKIKAPSSTSVSPPNPDSTRKPKKKSAEEKASREVKVSLPSVVAIKLPTETKTDPTKADKGKKTKTKTAAVEAPPEPTKDEKPKGEKRKDPKGEKKPKLVSTPNPTGLAHHARENGVKPLKSAIKSPSLPGGVKEKKKISFDLRSGKEGKGRKIGGKLSSKERLVGRGPRNA